MIVPVRTMIQSLIWPEPGLSTERDLYIQLDHGAALSMEARRVEFIPGGQANFGTYFNLFNCGKWHKYCGLETLYLGLEGAGTFELAVFYARPERSWDRQINEIVTLIEGAPLVLSVVPPEGLESHSALFFELRAMTEGHLTAATWQSDDTPRRTPELMLSITTFRREAAIADTVARFANFVRHSAIADHLSLTVVDNGQSADIPPTPNVTVLPNPNLGGSGGFARGLLTARSRGVSHCLFMDDDAVVHMEAIERTWAFLAYAIDPKTAVAGAVSGAQYRWRIWENGALFDRICRPQYMGLDLREIDEVLEMEFDSTISASANFYGGWWYFAFPVDAAQHMPFPFFVRGDDVSFSLVHDFVPVRLPGVMSFQDEDFSVKETPLTVYLDLRSHLVHHLALPQMDIGRLGIMSIVLRFYLRSLVFCHYDTLEAISLALEDVLGGPDFFSDNADMSVRRAEIGSLTDMERWRPGTGQTRKAERTWISPNYFLPRLAMKCTLNGHLLPGFKYFGNRITLPAAKRGQVRPIWGAAQITYVSIDDKRSYTVTHSKRRALATSRTILSRTWKIWRRYHSLCARWRAGYREMTQPGFWQKLLKTEDDRSERATKL